MTHFMFGSMFIGCSLGSRFSFFFFLFTKHPHVRTTQLYTLCRCVLDIGVGRTEPVFIWIPIDVHMESECTYNYTSGSLIGRRYAKEKEINCQSINGSYAVAAVAATKAATAYLRSKRNRKQNIIVEFTTYMCDVRRMRCAESLIYLSFVCRFIDSNR